MGARCECRCSPFAPPSSQPGPWWNGCSPGMPSRNRCHCRLISRSMNDTYRVTAGAETFFLRVSGHGWRSRDAVAAELAAIADLHARGVAVAPAVPRDDGTFLTSLRLRRASASRPSSPRPRASPCGISRRSRLAPMAGWRPLSTRPPMRRQRSTDRFQLDERHLLDEPLQAIRAAMQTSMVATGSGLPRSAWRSASATGCGRCRGRRPGTASVTAICTPAMSASMRPARRRSSTSTAWATAGAPTI